MTGFEFGLGESRPDMPRVQLQLAALECGHRGGECLTRIVEPSLVEGETSPRGGDPRRAQNLTFRWNLRHEFAQPVSVTGAFGHGIDG